ncbi:helix-turn-helix domain-containing protein [Methylobacterium oryzisoli]|uniref:helix-turn-helix domain-containing protein n=1 Tax=Methylobacterium oryzisoli TaxID=3385502 RepID=UPI0038917874
MPTAIKNNETTAATAVRMTLTIDEAAQQLGIGRNGAYEAAKRGEIPTIRIGRKMLVPLIPFQRMLQGQ